MAIERLKSLEPKAKLNLIRRVDLIELTGCKKMNTYTVSALPQTKISKLELELLRIEEHLIL